jgi:hypothetical protein
MTDVIEISTYKNVIFANKDKVADHLVVEQLFQNGLFKNMKVYWLDGKTGKKFQIAVKMFKDKLIGEMGSFNAFPVMDLFKDDGVGLNQGKARFEISSTPEGKLYTRVVVDERENEVARKAVKFASQRLHPQTMENFFNTKDQLKRGSLQSKFDNEFFNSNVNNSGPLEDPAFYSKSGEGKDATYGITYSLTPDLFESKIIKK